MYRTLHSMLPFIYAFKTFLEGNARILIQRYLFGETEVGGWKLGG